MSYTTKEKNNAILLIGQGKADFTNVTLYENLEKFNWIYITRSKSNLEKVELSYSGKGFI